MRTTFHLPRGFLAGAATAAAGMLAAHAVALVAGGANPLQRVAIVLVAVAVVFAAGRGGLVSGLAAGATGGVYAVAFFAAFATTVDHEARFLLGSAIAATLVTLGGLVGSMRDRGNAASNRAIVAEREKTLVATQANLALRHANETLEAFTYVVSHDLKEPVRALVVLHEVLETDHASMLPADGREALRLQGEAAARLQMLLAGLLEIGRAARTSQEEVHPVWIHEALDSPECRSGYADALRERNAQLEISCLQGTPPVLATTPAVCQILTNLLVNAVKHNPRIAPRLRVRIQPLDSDATEVETVVEDDGTGFSEAALARFDGPNPRTLREGGFGLLIVRRAVEGLGGRLWIGRSDDLGGAAVHFALRTPTGAVPRADRVPVWAAGLRA